MSTAEQYHQRVTVVSPFGQHQVELPVDVPVSAFLPDLLAMVGMHPSQATAGSAGWRLDDADGKTLPADATLAAHGILPGDVIQLRGVDDTWPGRSPSGAAGPSNGRDSDLVSRRVPRPRAPSGPPDDGLSPLRRAEALLPQRVGRLSRLIATCQAYLRGPSSPAGRIAAEQALAMRDELAAQAAARSAAAPGEPGSPAGPAGPAGSGGPVSPGPVSPGAVPPGAAQPGPVPPGGVPQGPVPPGAGQPGVAQSGAAQPGAVPAGAVAPGPHAGRQAGPAGPQPEQLRPLPRQPGRHRLLPADLTIQIRPSRMDCARAQWREMDHLGRLDARITEPRLRHCATIAVVSPKGGVGKTTITALLGTLLSLLRRDPIVAVDTNPDFGSLGRVLTPDQSWYVDDLARLVAEDDELSLTALDSQLGRAVHGLLVVPAPTDPDRMAALDEAAYGQVITRLKDFFSLILLDCGTGLQDPASAAAVAAADQVLLLTDAHPATASLVAQSADMLQQSGRPITVVVNRMPPRGGSLDLDRLSRYLPAARGLVVIPDQVPAATRLAGGTFDWRDAPPGWQLALRQLAVVLVADWQRLGLAQ
jgi:MinD-like ATPase involved in chromosome partitioning or flagellar assembly